MPKPLLVVITGQYRSGGGITAQIVNRLGIPTASAIFPPHALTNWEYDWVDYQLGVLNRGVSMPGDQVLTLNLGDYTLALRAHLKKRWSEAQVLARAAGAKRPVGIAIRDPQLALLMPQVRAAAAGGFDVVTVMTVRDEAAVEASVRRHFKGDCGRYLAANAMICAAWAEPDVIVSHLYLRSDPAGLVSQLALALNAGDPEAQEAAAALVRKEAVPCGV